MSDDIVTRLRERARQHQDDLLDLSSRATNLLNEAADVILYWRGIATCPACRWAYDEMCERHQDKDYRVLFDA